MKTLLFYIFISLFFIHTLNGQDCFSYYQGSKVFYNIAQDKVIVKFKSGMIQSQKEQKLANISKTKTIRFSAAIDGLTFIDFTGTTKKEIENIITTWRLDSYVTYASPVLLNDDGEEIGGLTDQFIVKLESTDDFPRLDSLSKAQNVKIVKQYEYDIKTYFIAIKHNGTNSSLEMANLFYETGFFEYSEPDFLFFVKKSTSDPFYGQQWALNNTGQNGWTTDNDMYVPEAWEMTTGCNTIRIAILDEGVDLTHPDLQGNLVIGFDATGGGSNRLNWFNSQAHLQLTQFLAQIQKLQTSLSAHPT